MMKKAVLDLTAQIVEANVAADPAFVNGCIGRALSTLKEAHEAARLYLHPDDIATVGEDTTDGYRNLTIAADPLLPRGSVRLEAGGGEIEEGVRPRIARLEQELRAARSEERRVGQECVSRCRARWRGWHKKKKKK